MTFLCYKKYILCYDDVLFLHSWWWWMVESIANLPYYGTTEAALQRQKEAHLGHYNEHCVQ